MLVMFVAFVFIILSFNFFMISYQINGVNRLVYGANPALFESSINLYNINEISGPYFSQTKLEKRLTSYFDYSMPKYTSDYSLDFYYYNPSDHSFCTSDNCSAFEATLKTELILNYHYEKTLFYEIRSSSWMSKN